MSIHNKIIFLILSLALSGESYIPSSAFSRSCQVFKHDRKHNEQLFRSSFIVTERTHLSVLQSSEETSSVEAIEETVEEEEPAVEEEESEPAVEEEESEPEDVLKLYLGNLPTTYETDAVRELLTPFTSSADDIKSISVPTDKFTGSPRGFAFVEMSTESGTKAIGALHESDVDGRTIKCNKQLSKEELQAQRGANPPTPRVEAGTKIYVGNISFETTQEELMELFEKYGPVEDCYLPVDMRTGYKRGFAFMRMLDEEQAQAAIDGLNDFTLRGRAIEVNVSLPRGVAPPRRNRQQRSYDPRTKIYIGNLPFDTTGDSLSEVFMDYGEVLDCYLPTDINTGRSRGFGFITMSKEDAAQAVDELDGINFGGRTLRINEAQPKGNRPRPARFSYDDDGFDPNDSSDGGFDDGY